MNSSSNSVEGEVLYRKVSRRYVPYAVRVPWSHEEVLRVGEAILITCPEPGFKRYMRPVRPASPEVLAAISIAMTSMEKAMLKASEAKPLLNKPLTKSQKKVLNECRERMAEVGMLLPNMWEHSTPIEIVQAGIDALLKSIKQQNA